MVFPASRGGWLQCRNERTLGIAKTPSPISHPFLVFFLPIWNYAARTYAPRRARTCSSARHSGQLACAGYPGLRGIEVMAVICHTARTVICHTARPDRSFDRPVIFGRAMSGRDAMLPPGTYQSQSACMHCKRSCDSVSRNDRPPYGNDWPR